MKHHALLLALPLALSALLGCQPPLDDGQAEIEASLGSYELVTGVTDVQIYAQQAVDLDDGQQTVMEWYEATVPVGDDISMVLLGVRGGLDHPALDDGAWQPSDDNEEFAAYLVGCAGESYGDWSVDQNAPAAITLDRRPDGRVDVNAKSTFEDGDFASLDISGLR